MTDARSEPRKVIDAAIIEATAKLRELIPSTQNHEATASLARTVRELSEARRAL